MIPENLNAVIISGDDVVVKRVTLDRSCVTNYDKTFFEALPELRTAVFFRSSHFRHPENDFPGDVDHAEWHNRMYENLVRYGMISRAALDKMRAEVKPCEDRYVLCIKPPDERMALELLKKADDGTMSPELELYDHEALIAETSLRNCHVAIVSGNNAEVKKIVIDMRRYDESFFEALPELATGAFFQCRLFSNPKATWPNKPSMWKHCREDVETLVEYEIITQEGLDALLAIPNHEGNGYKLCIKFPSEELVMQAFKNGMRAFFDHRLIDFYAYNNGKCIAKEDS